MKVLVTGGLGYLGRAVIEDLVRQGYSITVLDSMMYGNRWKGAVSNVNIIEEDIRNESAVRKALEDIDVLVHLAAIAGDAAANLDQEVTIAINYKASRRLAEICAQRGIRTIFASTCAVYGPSFDLQRTETSEVYPLSLYAVCKLSAEDAIVKHNAESTVFRFGTLFGYSERMRFDLIVNRFIAQAILEGKLTVFGGTQCRPFLHVRDAAAAITKATAVSRNGVYNLGGTNHKLIDIARLIQEKTSCEVSVLEELKDPRSYLVDSALAIKTFDIGFTKTVQDAVNEIKAEFSSGSLRDYKLPAYNNEEYLRFVAKGSLHEGQPVGWD
jgi:nucleoside-diphosphate-sugar epimerase